MGSTGVEPIVDRDGTILAIVIRDAFQGEKHNFITPNEFFLQVGVNFYGRSERIKPHLHLEQSRQVGRTQEFIYVKRGRVRLHLYADDKTHLTSVEMSAGDSVMLAHGGHGFDVLDDTTLVEAKQGPFSPTADKVTFEEST